MLKVYCLTSWFGWSWWVKNTWTYHCMFPCYVLQGDVGWLQNYWWNHGTCTFLYFLSPHISHVAIYIRIPQSQSSWASFTWPSSSNHQGNIQRPFGDVGWRVHQDCKYSTGSGKNLSRHWPPVCFWPWNQLCDSYCHSIAAVPPFPGLRRFPEGRGFKQWTGDDSKALMKVCTLLYWWFM